MRKIITKLAIALVPVLALAALAAPAQASTAAKAAPASCNELFDYGWDKSATPAWVGVDWENNSCGWGIQSRAECTSFLGTAYFKSGVVYALETNDRAYCDSSYPNLQHGYDRVTKDGGATWGTWNKLF